MPRVEYGSIDQKHQNSQTQDDHEDIDDIHSPKDVCAGPDNIIEDIFKFLDRPVEEEVDVQIDNFEKLQVLIKVSFCCFQFSWMVVRTCHSPWWCLK